MSTPERNACVYCKHRRPKLRILDVFVVRVTCAHPELVRESYNAVTGKVKTEGRPCVWIREDFPDYCPSWEGRGIA